MALLEKASSTHVFMSEHTSQHSEKSAHDREKKSPCSSNIITKKGLVLRGDLWAQATVTTDDWGACIRIEGEGRKPFTVSGRWDVIYVNPHQGTTAGGASPSSIRTDRRSMNPVSWSVRLRWNVLPGQICAPDQVVNTGFHNSRPHTPLEVVP